MKMADKNALEMQVRSLETAMGTIVKAFKDLKSHVKALEDKVEQSQNQEVREIMNSQKVLEELISEKSNDIKNIEMEIKKIQSEKLEAAPGNEKKNIAKVEKKCNYFNKGYCKYKTDCKFTHPSEICKTYIEGGRCDQKSCNDRHPNVCKWLRGNSGCRRQNCEYLHVTLARDDGRQMEAHKYFPCAGCKNCFEDMSCVVQHMIDNTALFLCLNCDDWIQYKERILTPGWSLLDQNGFLKRNI